MAQRLFIQELKIPSLWKTHTVDEDNNITYDESNFAILQVAEKLQEIPIEEYMAFEKDLTQLGSEESYRLVRLLRKPKADSPPSISIV